MSRGRHARDGQLHDDVAALARDTWALLRAAWLYMTILISRRAPGRAAGGAPAPSGAPEAPAPATPPGAGASPQLRAAEPEEGPPPPASGAAPRRDTWVRHEQPPGTPMPTGHHPFDGDVPFPRGQLYYPRADGLIVNRGTGAIEAVPDTTMDPPLVPRWYLAHEALLDAAVTA